MESKQVKNPITPLAIGGFHSLLGYCINDLQFTWVSYYLLEKYKYEPDPQNLQEILPKLLSD